MKPENKNITVEELRSLSKDQISAKLKVPPAIASYLKEASGNIEVLSDTSISNDVAAFKLGWSKPKVANYRSFLIKYCSLKPKDRSSYLLKTKKLGYLRSGKNRCISINDVEMSSAGLSMSKDYSIVVKPGNKEFVVKVFNTPEEAGQYGKGMVKKS